MLKGPLLLASFGLALNVLLWSVPAMVGATALAHQFSKDTMPSLAEALARVEPAGQSSVSLPDALLKLIGAESEAFDVVGEALQEQPAPADLAPGADHAGKRVIDAITTYVASARAAAHSQ